MSSVSEAITGLHRHLLTARPMLPTYLHLLISALLPIYAGAHASLTRPSSAAKPSESRKKTAKKDDEDEELEEDITSKIEGLSASDAIWFPILAGCTLGGLYLIIKWLEDPSILSTILNWYFAVFGVLGVAKLFKDSSDVATSYIFPARYSNDGQIWKFDDLRKLAKTQSPSVQVRTSPFPGSLSRISLPPLLHRIFWTLRCAYPTLCIRLHLRPSTKTHAHITPSTILSFLAALSLVLYYNLLSRPWFLTNILGFAFAYNALQFISPTTSSTGTLILCSLFLYDIYFVFFTPLMVTVATNLDIPAKLLFPRPPGPDSDPTKQHLSMLGLGDIVLPGMMIGFALRLDLYLHYLKQQKSVSVVKADGGNSTPNDQGRINEPDTREATKNDSTTDSNPNTDLPTSEEIQSSPSSYAPDPSTSKNIIVKPPYLPATGYWGTRFWTSRFFLSSSDPSVRGIQFPKPYFHASLAGYVIGMLLTLGIMQVTGHAQPALFYLVPCVLVCFWGTALLKREVREVWNFDESEESKAEEAEAKDGKEDGKELEKKDEKNEQKDKKGEKRSSSPPGRTTVDFLNLNLKVGITESKGTKGCQRKGAD
ncbi:MAG: hypothetical protein Q9225_000144 [Loekoesia sp. 1 TL-2023]